MKKTKSAKIFSVISLLLLLSFTSCNNVFENSVSTEENTNTQNNASQTDDKTGPAVNRPSSNPAATIVFGGTLAINGAVPAEFVEPEEAAENQQSGRSANAELPGGTDYEYYVKATSNDGLVHEDIIPAASTSKDYSLQLEINKTWTFTAGYRKKASGTPGTDSYVAPVNLLIDIDSDSGHPYSLTLTDTRLQPVEAKTFILKPLQNGRGTIDLTMTVPSGIDDLKLFTSGENGVLTPWQTDALDVTTTSIKTKENMTIASGSYDVTMIFYNGEFQAYITYQTINVFDNMETKVWESGNAPGTESIISGGSFQLTTSLVQKFASSTIYVGAPEGVTVEPDDSRVGSPFAPVKTLERAFSIIQANTSGDGNTRDYRILVTTAKPTAEKAAQPQKANLEIPADITTSQAKSIEIVGIGTSPELRPAATNPGTVLTVNTAVPVKLSNIKITGGQGSDGKGGAISITQNDAKVTLESGTEISGNSASDQGGGIYIQGSDASHKPKLIIKAGAKIKSNSIGTSGTGGMAIYADCAEVEMTGGEISGNSKAGAQYGAVRLTGASEFTMTGGSVANNDGGAFYVDSDYDAGTSTYTHSKLKIGGSARIPYGVNGTTGQKKNDVYIVRANQTDPSGGKYSPLEIAGAITVEEGTKIAAITPDGWQRGLDILKTNSGVINDYKDYFITTDPYFILSNQATAQISKLKAPVVVSNNPSINPSDSNSGTREHPYATLAFALSQLGGGEEDTILIDGLISTPSEEPNGKYEIPGSFIVSQCSALTLKGANGLNTDGTPKDGFAVPEGGSGSVLTVDSPVPVKIENLKLTGGKGTYNDIHYPGGGLYLNSGTVTLADGAQITGNRATHGAGIFIESNGTLYMYGSSLIGEKKGGSITSAPSVYSQASNYCSSGHGGGIYSKGNVFIGYERWSSDTDNTPKAMAEGYGILHNFAGSQGGGLISMGGKVRMASGTIGINYSGDKGGGFCEIQSTDCILSGGSMEDNVSKNGGAIYIGTNLTAELKNNLEIKNNEATTAGGAVYVAGTLKIQDAVSIPYGVNGSLGAKKNDVYLNTDKTITVSGSFSSSAPVTVATITLPWARGAQFLQAGDSLTSLPDGIMDKFAFTDAGWDKKRYTKNSTNDAAKIDADIYVAGSNPAKCKTSDGASAPTDTDNTIGNWAHPFASISAALSSGLLDASHDTIIVDGTVSGAQSISGTGSLSAVAIKGYKAAGATSSSAKIDAGGTTDAGSALTVDASGKTVTITDLTITGGTGSDLSGGTTKNGGGIYLNAGTVKLADGAVITGNSVANNGGGVYVNGSSSNLYMAGKALIGDSAASTSRASSASGYHANKAVNGGGIYNNGGSVYIGSDSSGTAATGYMLVNNDTDGHYGVRRNFSTGGGCGAGIYHESGTLLIASGDISHNNAGSAQLPSYSGGGIYCNANATISGGTFTDNYANHGGALYIATGKSVTVNGASTFTGNGAHGRGGAVCNYGTFTMSAGTIGGTDVQNQVTINDTVTSYGGAIYQEGTFNLSGSACVYPGSVKTNDVYLAYGKTVTIAGTLNPPSGVTTTLTPSSYSRGRNILSSTSANSTNLSNAIGKFKLSQDDGVWDRGNNISVTSETTKNVWITSPIYVVDATDSGNTRPTGFEKGKTTGANGTKTYPYASIEAALGCSDLALCSNTIKVVGTIGAQALGSTIPSGVSSFTIEGYDSNATIKPSSGSALTISAAKTVTIKTLKITGGSASQGGGININAAATVNLDSGAVVTGNKATSGGKGAGVYVASGATLNVKTGSEISSNTAYSGSISGGGIYNDGTVTMTGGTISSNTAATGGAIYNANSLTLNGSLSIPAGTGAGANDIAVYYDSSAATPAMKMVSAGSSLSATASSIAITPTSWIRGKQVLTGTASKYGCFKMSDTNWSIISSSTSSTHAGKIDAPIYVSASGNGSKGSDVTTAYTSLATAVGKCWLGPTDTNSTNGRIIYISGTVTGAQSIPNTILSTTHASKITLQGTGTSPQLNGGFTSESKGTTLTVSSSVPIVIKSLTITGGYISSSAGAGIRIEAGSVDLASGAVVSGNTASYNGGGVYVSSGTTLTISGGSVKKNVAATGGGVYVASTSDTSYGTLTMTSGSIGETSNYNTATTQGGAVWLGQYSKFNISGSATIPYGGLDSNKKPINDVFLSSGNTVNVPYSLSGSGTVATLSPAWTRGTQVLSGSYGTSSAGRFAVSDTDFTIISSGTYKGMLDSVDQTTIYVSASDARYGTEANGYNVGSTSGRGTQKKPYLSITDAVKQTWRAEAYTIKVNGTIEVNYTGDMYAHKIPNDDSVKATSITIEGNGSGATIQDNTNNHVFTIEKTVPVTIKKLTLKHKDTTSFSTAYGGGIYSNVAGVDITLGEGALVTCNYAQYNGGGIYLVGAEGNLSTLKMTSTAQVKGNKAAYSTSGKGGGIYLKYANLCMCDSALVGVAKSDSSVPANTSDTDANIATNLGGGVYCDIGANIYLGYSAPNTNSNSKKTLNAGYGIVYNYSQYGGGGVYFAGGNMYINTGEVSNNYDSRYGGGIYISNGIVNMSGGKMLSNKAYPGTGSGVYIDSSGTFDFNGGSIGETGRANQGQAVHNKGIFYYGDSAMIPVISNQNFIYLGTGKPMTLKCEPSNVTFTGSIKLETYSYGATVIARGNEITDQDIYMACNHFNLASNNYCMYLSTDGTTGIRSTDLTSVNDIKNYPNVSWSTNPITFTVPKNEFCEKAFLVQIDSSTYSTYAVCELSCQMTNYNDKRDVLLYSIIYTDIVQSTHNTAWQNLELNDGGMHVDWTAPNTASFGTPGADDYITVELTAINQIKITLNKSGAKLYAIP